jgi:hypothetical protein
MSEGEDVELLVGALIARPNEPGDGENEMLVVDFSDWEVEIVER